MPFSFFFFFFLFPRMCGSLKLQRPDNHYCCDIDNLQLEANTWNRIENMNFELRSLNLLNAHGVGSGQCMISCEEIYVLEVWLQRQYSTKSVSPAENRMILQRHGKIAKTIRTKRNQQYLVYITRKWRLYETRDDQRRVCWGLPLKFPLFRSGDALFAPLVWQYCLPLWRLAFVLVTKYHR